MDREGSDDDWLGITLTGVAIGGSALLFHGIFGFFAGLYRKFDHQAEQLEKTVLGQVEPISKAS